MLLSGNLYNFNLQYIQVKYTIIKCIKQFSGRPIYVSWAVPKHKYEGEVPNKDIKLRTVSFSSDGEETKPEEMGMSQQKLSKTYILVSFVFFKQT